MEITNMVVTCKLSDGTVRAIITDRETEVQILKTIRNSSKGELIVSNNPIIGMDIVAPEGYSLNEYINYCG
jgi:uncharacterized protein YebE (UPF0316 family)